VLDCTGIRGAPLEAVVHAVADSLYRAAVADRSPSLPWLLVDEAHACERRGGGRRGDALHTGAGARRECRAGDPAPERAPAVAVSQSDLVVAHRLTSQADVDALAAAQPTYLAGSVASRLPAGRGEALVVDDATESACTVRVRERRTEHGGGSAERAAAPRRKW